MTFMIAYVRDSGAARRTKPFWSLIGSAPSVTPWVWRGFWRSTAAAFDHDHSRRQRARRQPADLRTFAVAAVDLGAGVRRRLLAWWDLTRLRALQLPGLVLPTGMRR